MTMYYCHLSECDGKLTLICFFTPSCKCISQVLINGADANITYIYTRMAVWHLNSLNSNLVMDGEYIRAAYFDFLTM